MGKVSGLVEVLREQVRYDWIIIVSKECMKSNSETIQVLIRPKVMKSFL